MIAALLCLPLLARATAFIAAPKARCGFSALHVSKDLAFNPQGNLPVDIDRATYCAEHFASCPVEEMEQLHNNLHLERMQHFALGGPVTGLEMPQGQRDHLVIEEELELQLNLLKDTTPYPTLFPEVEGEMEELPHLRDNTVSHRVEDIVHRAENALAMQETVLEESNLETLVICSVVLALAVSPQIANILIN